MKIQAIMLNYEEIMYIQIELIQKVIKEKK